MKNSFTIEGISLGVSLGLEMVGLLDLLDGASGQRSAANDKFPNCA